MINILQCIFKSAHSLILCSLGLALSHPSSSDGKQANEASITQWKAQAGSMFWWYPPSKSGPRGKDFIPPWWKDSEANTSCLHQTCPSCVAGCTPARLTVSCRGSEWPSRWMLGLEEQTQHTQLCTAYRDAVMLSRAKSMGRRGASSGQVEQGYFTAVSSKIL